MGEALTRGGLDAALAEGPLKAALQRLDGALEGLERRFEQPSALRSDEARAALVVELDGARRRQRTLKAAAARAATSLDAAAEEVKALLDEDSRRQGLLDLGPDTEPAGEEEIAGSMEEEAAAASPVPSEEEPGA